MSLSRKQKKQLLLIVSVVLTTLTFMLISGFFFHEKAKKVDVFSYLEKPFYQGFSKSGNKYEINSERATQIGEFEYSLENVFFKYYQDKEYNTYFTISSDKGSLDDSKKVFTFIENVEMIQSSGYRAKTDKFLINFNEMNLFTNDRFILTSAKMRLMSDSGVLYQPREKKMLFHGSVKTVIINHDL